MATFNSQPVLARRFALTLAFCLMAGFIVMAGGTPGNFAARARAEFHRTQEVFESNTNNATAAWKFARACFNLADFATNSTEHASVARLGIAACRQTLAIEPDSAPGHYYLGLNLGELARVETLGALRLVKQMEREFKLACKLDGRFDDAGPERTLGLLYRDAPGWPISIGNRHKALQWLNAAEHLAPGSPENHLNLLETYLEWHQSAEAEQELKELNALWPSAKTNLTGQAWAQDWADWTSRRRIAEKKLDENSGPEKSSTGRHDP